jgi:hypothetical protein
MPSYKEDSGFQLVGILTNCLTGRHSSTRGDFSSERLSMAASASETAILESLVGAMNTPDATRGIRNLIVIVLAKVLGSIRPGTVREICSGPAGDVDDRRASRTIESTRSVGCLAHDMQQGFPSWPRHAR